RMGNIDRRDDNERGNSYTAKGKTNRKTILLRTPRGYVSHYLKFTRPTSGAIPRFNFVISHGREPGGVWPISPGSLRQVPDRILEGSSLSHECTTKNPHRAHDVPQQHRGRR